MPVYAREAVPRRPRGKPMATASTVPMTEIWIVSKSGTTSRRRNSTDKSGGNMPVMNRAMFRRPSASKRSPGWIWASCQLPTKAAAKQIPKRIGNRDLLWSEEGSAASDGFGYGIGGILGRDTGEPPGIQVRQEVIRDLIGRPIEGHLAVPEADDPREIGQGQVHAVQVHDQGLVEGAAQLHQKLDDAVNQRRVHGRDGLVREDD